MLAWYFQMQSESYLFQKESQFRLLVSKRASYPAGFWPVGEPHAGFARFADALTTEDMRKVSLTTIREGFNHCCWLREVIERFFGADSIVLPDGYEDDHDLGKVVMSPSQSGRRSETGKKAADQLLTSGNLASAVSQIHGYKLPHFQCQRSRGRSQQSSVSASVG